MKKTALYFLLFCYSTIMLKPVTPYLSDLAAHIFYYSKHMATVHYEQGKFHIHKDVADNEKKDSQAPSLKKDNPVNDHISLQQNGQPGLAHRTNYSKHRSLSLPNYLPYRDYPPPRA